MIPIYQERRAQMPRFTSLGGADRGALEGFAAKPGPIGGAAKGST